MAHECPDCGQTCYCHGDIDDCLFENSEEQAICDHCPMDDELDNDGEISNREKEEAKGDYLYDQMKDRELIERDNTPHCESRG